MNYIYKIFYLKIYKNISFKRNNNFIIKNIIKIWVNFFIQ